ncbi:MAG TPA: hypothetical protein VF939_22105 [Puia sp.]
MDLPYRPPVSFLHFPRCPGFFSSGNSSIPIDHIITSTSIIPGGHLKRNELA